jgi:hypothetical protein
MFFPPFCFALFFPKMAVPGLSGFMRGFHAMRVFVFFIFRTGRRLYANGRFISTNRQSIPEPI